MHQKFLKNRVTQHLLWTSLVVIQNEVCEILAGTASQGGGGLWDFMGCGFGRFYPRIFGFFSKNRAGFRVKYLKRATGFATFLTRVSGIVVKMCGFSGLKPCKEYQCVKFLKQ